MTTSQSGAGRFVVRPEAQKREPLPRGEVKIRAPKAAPKAPTKPNITNLLPSILMGLVYFLVIFLFQSDSGSGRTAVMAVPILAVGFTMAGLQVWNYKRASKKHEAEMAEREADYRHYLVEVGEKLAAYQEQQQAILRHENPSAADMSKQVEWRSQQLWRRLPEQESFLQVRLGLSRTPLPSPSKRPKMMAVKSRSSRKPCASKTSSALCPTCPSSSISMSWAASALKATSQTAPCTWPLPSSPTWSPTTARTRCIYTSSAIAATPCRPGAGCAGCRTPMSSALRRTAAACASPSPLRPTTRSSLPGETDSAAL
ncbi:MAG: hypothetical protein M5U34_16765 [Chloroflexi bacterium]|nr:hypothetical protein [Chloroflexota bacterium]